MKNRKINLIIVASLLILAMVACSIPEISFQNTLVEHIQEEVSEAVVDHQENDQPSFLIANEVLLQDALVGLYETVSPGVVSIQVYSGMGSGIGSGFVIDNEGHIVTNYHVVQGAEEVEVHFPSGLKVYGQVIGEDLDSDLAVVKVDIEPEHLFPVPLADSDQVRVGQSVVAIGNPFGLSGTMTVGIVSARGRTLESMRQTETGAFFSTGDLIQTDATINPGNSGGPLLNLNGEVVGVNRALQTGGGMATGVITNTGIGFAVSSNILKLVLPTLQAGEIYNYPFLGLSSLPSLTLTEAELLELPQANGAYIVDLVPGGPSDQAGLQSGDQPTQLPGLFAGGDLIIGVDDVEVLEFSELLTYMLLNKKPGDTMGVRVLRNGEELTFTVTLGLRPTSVQ